MSAEPEVYTVTCQGAQHRLTLRSNGAKGYAHFWDLVALDHPGVTREDLWATASMAPGAVMCADVLLVWSMQCAGCYGHPIHDPCDTPLNHGTYSLVKRIRAECIPTQAWKRVNDK